MEEKIKKRLKELYKKQARLEDKTIFYIKETNGLTQHELILVNSSIIKELESLL